MSTRPGDTSLRLREAVVHPNGYKVNINTTIAVGVHKQMRPLVVYPHEGTLVGGSIQSSILMSKFLLSKGWNVIHVFPSRGPASDITLKEGLAVEFLDLPARDILALRNTKGVLRKLRSVLPYTRSTWKAYSWLRNRRPILVHVNDDRSMISWGAAAKLLGIPVLWHVRQRSGSRIIDVIRLWFANYLIFIANDTKSRFAGMRALPKHTVVYNPVDLTAFCPPTSKAVAKENLGLDRSMVVVGYIGNLIPRKRPEWVAQIVADLLQDGLNVAGVFAGSDFSGGDYIMRLTRIARSSLKERFLFLGYRSDVNKIMQALDILCLPSIAEPFGRVLIEAMACGVAVVATNAGGVPEIIVNGVNGLLVSPDDYEAMREAVRTLVLNPEMRVRLAQAGERHVRTTFESEKVLANLVDIYEQLSHTRTC